MLANILLQEKRFSRQPVETVLAVLRRANIPPRSRSQRDAARTAADEDVLETRRLDAPEAAAEGAPPPGDSRDDAPEDVLEEVPDEPAGEGRERALE